MADTATVQARLDEAEKALHELTIGRRAEAFTHGAGDVNRSLKWTPANIADLRAYIADLRRQLGQTTRRRAIGVTFR